MLTTYGNRAAHLLAGGIHKADAAILYHADAEWINERGEAMPTQIPAKILYDAHIDFDILPADCFTENSGGRVYTAVAEHGRLRVGNKRYHCLIVPAAKRLPAHLLQALDALKSAGVPVLRIGDNIGLQELLPALNALFVPDIEIRGEHPMLRCCHYEEKDKEDAEKTTGTDIYMFVNESITETVRTEAALRGIGDTPGVMLDLLNDGAFAITVSGGVLPLCLAPYQSVIVILERNKNSNGGNSNADGKENYSEICPAPDSLYELPAKKNWKEAGNAALTFTVEIAPYTNPEQYTIYADNVKSNRLFSITDRSHMPDFSGTIRYTASFRRSDIPPLIESPFAAASSGIAVEFKEVGQTAHLWCNGKDLGVRVCPPYRYDLTEALRGDENEQNTLVITVANTLANALRDPFSPFLRFLPQVLPEKSHGYGRRCPE